MEVYIVILILIAFREKIKGMDIEECQIIL